MRCSSLAGWGRTPTCSTATRAPPARRSAARPAGRRRTPTARHRPRRNGPGVPPGASWPRSPRSTCAASAVKDRVQRKLPGLMEYPVRTSLTPAVQAASSKEQGDHSMWGKPRKASYQRWRVVSARCAWRELHCPNSCAASRGLVSPPQGEGTWRMFLDRPA